MATETRDMLYLDYNASAPCRDEVIADMLQVLRASGANPSSIHREGKRLRQMVEESRARVARALGAEPSEIVFTSGGTESDNLAVLGMAMAASGATPHVVTSNIEHPAVREACHMAVGRNLATVSWVPCDSMARIDPAAVADVLDRETALVSIMHANNEVGSIQPIRHIVDLARECGSVVHCDAVQSLGRIPVNVNALGVDLLSVSSHKVGGPKGVGALYVRSGIRLAPLLVGGAHERDLRAGTENVSGIVGFARAVEIAVGTQPEEEQRLRDLKLWLWGEIAMIPGISLNGDLHASLPNTLNVSFEDLSSETLTDQLDQAGIAVSAGSACAVGAGKASHVIEAMGATSRGCGPVRISMGYRTTKEDVARCAQALRESVSQLRRSGKRCCCTR